MSSTIIGKALLRAIGATACFVAFVWLLAQPASAESRVALVIGNGAYEVPELPNPLATRPTSGTLWSD
jgi:hypothetical protein